MAFALPHQAWGENANTKQVILCVADVTATINTQKNEVEKRTDGEIKFEIRLASEKEFLIGARHNESFGAFMLGNFDTEYPCPDPSDAQNGQFQCNGFFGQIFLNLNTMRYVRSQASIPPQDAESGSDYPPLIETGRCIEIEQGAAE